MDRTDRIPWLLRIVVILLAAQFVLGIWVNLFGSFPSTNSVGTALMYGGDPVLTGHYLLGVLLFVLAVVLAASSFGPGTAPRVRWLVVAGLLSVVWAATSGVEFILSGFSNAGASFSMALAFIVAMTFYGLAQAEVLKGEPTASRKSEDVPVASP